MRRATLMALAPLFLAGCVIYDEPAAWIPAREPLTPERLTEMKRAGRSDSEIRRELEFHGVAYKLNSDDLVDLKEAGAGDALLTAAASAPVKTPREAKPVYERRSHSYCRHCWHGPGYFATGLTLGYLFNRGYGHHHHWGHRHRSRW